MSAKIIGTVIPAVIPGVSQLLRRQVKYFVVRKVEIVEVIDNGITLFK